MESVKAYLVWFAILAAFVIATQVLGHHNGGEHCKLTPNLRGDYEWVC